ncbi:Heterotrimeric G-protein alpha subunit [Mycena sanguinolenta]|uniref:Heterotrimeric G-protein alpha subunit n=1 Tax=Mycena sanguinolenta TaxID=230812 RepID=A0A8H6YR74_9AGAR|nr:Heterotrimeric G-protein alpha subunit [Mycena sanguinolenta]
MGACISLPDLASKARNDKIERLLDEDLERYKRECKILLLGLSGSGKSTVMKQMKILHQQGYTADERLALRPTIHQNAVDSAQAIVHALSTCGLQNLLEKSHRHLPEAILEADREAPLSRETADAVEELWRDPVVARLLDEHQTEFYLMDSAAYFLGAIRRLAQPEYTPTEEDVLRARTQSMGIIETRFNMGTLSMHMFDLSGQRSERRKWIHCFENVTSIIFCTSLSEYAPVLSDSSRMLESLVLFESVINSRWFLRTSIILFLNKIDVFRTMLDKVPLEHYFPEYDGGSDASKASKYIMWRFVHLNRAKLSVYPHITQATDTRNIQVVFVNMQQTIWQQNGPKVRDLL